MNLADLDKVRGQYKVILLQSPSSVLNMWLNDKIRFELGSNQDTIYDVKAKNDVRGIKVFQNTEPYMSRKWLVNVELKSVGTKDLVEVIKTSTTVVFFCVAENYRTYKNFKEALKGVDFVYDFYLTRLRKDDFLYLYRKYTAEGNTLTKKMYDYVYQSYSNDVEACMDLFKALQSGQTIETRKDVADICGVGKNSIESFVLSLLSDPPSTVKGLKTVMGNRMKAGVELAEIYKWRSFYNLVNSCVDCFIDIKMLRISGAIYKRIDRLPEGYDEKKLSRYQRYLWKIHQLPMSMLLTLKTHLMRGQWLSELEFLRFLYGYWYERVVIEVVPKAEEQVQAKLTEIETKRLESNRKAEASANKAETLKRVELIEKYGLVRAKEILASGEAIDSAVNRGSVGVAATQAVKSRKSKEEEKVITAEEAAAFFNNYLRVGGN